MLHFGLRSLVVIPLVTSLAACAAATEEGADDDGASALDGDVSGTLRASSRREHAALGSVVAIREVRGDGRAVFHVYDTVGAPGSTGRKLWLGVASGEDDPRIFDLGLEGLETFGVVSMAEGTLLLTTARQGTRDFVYEDVTIAVGAPPGTSVPVVEVRRQTGAHIAVERDDASTFIMRRLQSMQSSVEGRTPARAFATMPEVTGGGGNAYLALSTREEGADVPDSARTFDLGVRLARVTKVSAARLNRFRVEGTELTWGIETPAAYEVEFSVTERAPGDAIVLRKLRR